PALLGDLLVRLRLLRGQLALLEPRQEDDLELEPLRGVVGQQVDAATLVAPVAEPPLELVPEVRHARRSERLGDPHETREVVLADLLALAEPLRRRVEPPLLQRQRAHLLCDRPLAFAQAPEQEPRSLAAEQRRALGRDAGLVQGLLEVGEPRVRAAEDRDLLQRAAGGTDP